MNYLQKSLTTLLVFVAIIFITGCSKHVDENKSEKCCNESPIVIENDSSFKEEITQLKDVQDEMAKEEEINEINKKEAAAKIAEEMIKEEAVKEVAIEQIKEQKDLIEK